jgi:hypothetical protein
MSGEEVLVHSKMARKEMVQTAFLDGSPDLCQ